MAKLYAAKCPTCGAALSVPPGAHNVTCRYCNHVITIEHRKPPPEVHPFGTPGGMPSTTLYVDPEQIARAARSGITVMLVVICVPVLLSVIGGIVAFGSARRTTGRELSQKSRSRTFPTACEANESIELTGSYEGTGSLLTAVGGNCKIRISNARVKGASLIKGAPDNLELTLENATIETSEVMIEAGGNAKIRVTGGSLKSKGDVVDAPNNLELTLDGTTLSSAGGAAVHAGMNAKLIATNSRLDGQNAMLCGMNCKVNASRKASLVGTSSNGVETDTNGVITLSEASLEGARTALKGGANLKVKLSNGARIAGKSGAISGDVNMELDATGATIDGGGGAGIEGTMNARIALRQGSVKGSPALTFGSKPSSFRNEGARIEGEQRNVGR